MRKLGTALLLCLFIVCNQAFAQPTWSVNAGDYSYSMTATGVINLNYTEEMDANNMVGAFVGGVCRGVAQPIYDGSVNRYVVYLLIYSNTTGETVDFQVYDASSGSTIPIAKTMAFAVNGIVGSAEQPYVWSDPTLSSDADILTYSFPGQSVATVFSGTDISITMPFGTDVSNLVADFTTSPYAAVSVNTVAQTTGVTSNDFSNVIDYLVVAADGTTQQTYSVSVSVANGTPSDIALSNYDITESTPMSSVVANISTTDIDAADTHTYTLVSGTGDTDNSKFLVSVSDLVINTASDYETQTSYSIRLKTTDSQGASFEKQFTLNVLDENDEVPVITPATVQLLETTLTGEQVHQVVAMDADANTTLTYSISNGNTGSAFGINSSTGAIVINSPLDYETTTTYSLEISAFDGVNTGTGIITVNIVDVNDETPVVLDATENVSESTALNTIVHNVTATDADANSVLTYSITSGNSAGKFTINTSTGAIKLVSALDYELVQAYYLSVEVNDGVHTGTAEITINVVDENDETPVVSNQSVYVSETEPTGIVVTTVTATDADANTVFTYSISSGNDEGKFSINSSTGVITLISTLNYEVTSTYVLAINVSDGLNSATEYVTVNVQALNDEPPVVTSANVSVSESAIMLETVHQVEATDPDGGSVFEFSIASGNTGSAFEIDPAYGIIRVIGTLDYETTPSYSLVINVDDGLHVSSGVILIYIINENDEAVIVQPDTVSVDEDLLVTNQIVQVDAVDPDGLSTLSYKILAGNVNNTFAIDPALGLITLQNELDYEEITQYILTIGVYEGTDVVTTNIVVNINDVNDEVPVMSDTTFTINEFANIGTEIGQLLASDRDVSSTITFSIQSADEDSVFKLTNNGLITLNDNLDYETKTSYTLTILVSDSVNSSTGVVTIEVTDGNEAAFNAVNVFTPNNDGINEFWEVGDSHLYTECEFNIFNNLGELVFQSTGYYNNWDGTNSNGDPLPVGTYYYVVNCPSCDVCDYTGFVSIVR